MAKVPNGIKTLPKNFNRLSRGHERYRRQTDDRRTGGKRKDDFTFAKTDVLGGSHGVLYQPYSQVLLSSFFLHYFYDFITNRPMHKGAHSVLCRVC